MNYIEKLQIENVQTIIKVSEDKLFYISRDLNLEYIHLENNFEKSVICYGAINVNVYKDHLNISVKSDIAGSPYPLLIFNINSETRIISHVGISSNFSVNKNDCEIIYSKKDSGNNYALYNYNSCDGTDELIMPGKLLYNPFYVSPLVLTRTEVGSFPDHLTAYNLDDRKVEWQFDVREIGKYYSEEDKKWENGQIDQVVVVGNKVVLLLQLKLICLDIASGCLVWIKEFEEYYPNKIVYNEVTRELLLFDSKEFAFIDPSTGNVLRASTTFTEIRSAIGIRISNFTYPTVTEKYIYITFCYDLKIVIVNKYDFSVIAVINMDAKDIISQTSPPFIYGNLVLQQSMDRVLHVYSEALGVC
jgi:hypothetical protein